MWPGKPASAQVPAADFPAPSNAGALWDSAKGITLGAPTAVSQWTDQIGGRVLSQTTASQRPVYAVDTVGNTARKCVQTATTGTKYINGLNLTNLATTGDYAYLAAITRERTIQANGLTAHFTVDGDNTFALRTAFALSARGDGAGTEYWYCHRNSAGTGCDWVSGDIQDTQWHFWEWVLDAAVGTSYYLDGVLMSTISSAQGKAGLASPQFNVWIGNSAPYCGDVNVHILVHCPSKPTATERARMLTWSRTRIGSP